MRTFLILILCGFGLTACGGCEGPFCEYAYDAPPNCEENFVGPLAPGQYPPKCRTDETG